MKLLYTHGRKICWLLVVSIYLSACNKLVAVSPPETLLVTASVFSNGSTATAAQTNIYTEMESNFMPYEIPLFTGISADELTSYATDASVRQFYTNSLNPLNSYLTNIWTPAYSYIYQANAVLFGLQGSNAISSPIKQQLIGEALFVRAFWNFYLVNLFGDVPLVTTTDYTVTAVASRVSQAQVYQQIIADLKTAETDLNTNFVDATDTTVTTDRVRPTSWAATALLARVYLFNGKYDSAEAAATTVINNTGTFGLVPNLDSVFLANSKEAIWQLMIPQPSSFNTVEAQYFILNGPPSLGIFNSATISSQLLSAFEPGDKRMTTWIGNYTANANTYFFPYKYKNISSIITEYSMVLRLAEQFLIRAEARAQQGNITGATSAISDLNTIRNRAGLSGYSGPTDLPSVLGAIWHERQVELFAEWGHRWLDLKRTGTIDAVMDTVTPHKGGSWTVNDALYPIPQTEITNDPNLSQNEGY